MNEINNLAEVMREQDAAENKLKDEWKRKLKGLINVAGLFRWLDEGHDWAPLNIVEIQLTDEKRSGYSQYQHARIIDDKDKLLYLQTDISDEIRKVSHYYVWQTVGVCEDDYSGYLLFPLKDGKYFKVSYSC